MRSLTTKPEVWPEVTQCLLRHSAFLLPTIFTNWKNLASGDTGHTIWHKNVVWAAALRTFNLVRHCHSANPVFSNMECGTVLFTEFFYSMSFFSFECVVGKREMRMSSAKDTFNLNIYLQYICAPLLRKKNVTTGWTPGHVRSQVRDSWCLCLRYHTLSSLEADDSDIQIERHISTPRRYNGIVDHHGQTIQAQRTLPIMIEVTQDWRNHDSQSSEKHLFPRSSIPFNTSLPFLALTFQSCQSPGTFFPRYKRAIRPQFCLLSQFLQIAMGRRVGRLTPGTSA